MAAIKKLFSAVDREKSKVKAAMRRHGCSEIGEVTEVEPGVYEARCLLVPFSIRGNASQRPAVVRARRHPRRRSWWDVREHYAEATRG